MLNRPVSQYVCSPLRASQRGMVLVIALIVLVAMTLAGIALIRSVDTSNIIAGNLAFQQAATHSSDRAVEAAIAWLEDCNGARITCTALPPFNSDPSNGYTADGSSVVNPHQPSAGQSWDTYWNTQIDTVLATNSRSLGVDAAGNTSSYIIDRMCQNAGAPTAGASCGASPVITVASGNEEEANQMQLNLPSLIYYRITVRTTGPRNTSSYVQVIVAM